uniref:SH2 domain-containing protein n=1 Tax=Xiphophorus couchianus TaxID=32473 RepID=A0A3B5MDH7_9TELE
PFVFCRFTAVAEVLIGVGEQLQRLQVQIQRFPDESVWIWIDGILDLIKKFVWELWRDGCIMGFVSKERTRSLLREKPVGTFLIRFSESILDGAITFSWVEQSKRIHAVEPYTKKELSVLSLPNAIYSYTLTTSGRSHNPLVYLYPDTPKDAAFARYRVAGTERRHQAVFTSGDGSDVLFQKFLCFSATLSVNISEILSNNIFIFFENF